MKSLVVGTYISLAVVGLYLGGFLGDYLFKDKVEHKFKISTISGKEFKTDSFEFKNNNYILIDKVSGKKVIIPASSMDYIED